LAWDRNVSSKCRFCRIEGRGALAARLGKAAESAADAEGSEAESGQAVPATAVAVRQGPVVDYKDVRTLQRLSTPQGKLFSRKRSGTCATHQRQVKRAIKRARFLALLPYVGR
jgi:small subunit ribosomal protein S18